MLTTCNAGFMRVFFKKMGIENLRFKPAYNPYTEVRATYALWCARRQVLIRDHVFHIAFLAIA